MKKTKYTKEILETAAKESLTMSDVIRKITGKTKVHGSMLAYIKTKMEEYEINTSHFLGRSWCLNKKNPTGVGRSKEEFIKTFLITNSPYISTYQLKNKLLNFGLLKYQCSGDNCEIKDVWLGKKITLQLDHKNGNREDNRLKNLRLLCPNCHSQTDTYAGKNNLKK